MASIEIDYETEEKIVRASLMESMSHLKEYIDAALNQEGPLSDASREELVDELGYLTAAQQICKYYTKHTEWELIDAFDVDIDAVRAKLAEEGDIDWEEVAVDADLDIDLTGFNGISERDLKIDPEAL